MTTVLDRVAPGDEAVLLDVTYTTPLIVNTGGSSGKQGVVRARNNGRPVAGIGTPKTRESGVSWVVAHSRSGTVFHGFAGWNTTGEEFEIITRDGKAVTFRRPLLKLFPVSS